MMSHSAAAIGRRLIILSLLTLVVACSSWQVTEVPVEKASVWQARGKIGIRFMDEAHSAFFKWENTGKFYHITLTGPLGQGKVILKRTRQGVTLSSNQGTFKANTAEELMLQQLGWSIPVSDMRFWLLGLQTPSQTPKDVQRDAKNRITHMEQDGWSLKFRSYMPVREQWLPAKLIAQHQRVRLVIALKHWNLEK